MQASNGEIEGLGVTIGDRQASWKKEVMGKSVTHHHTAPTHWRVVDAADGKSCA